MNKIGYGMHIEYRPKQSNNQIKKCKKCNSKQFRMKHSGPHIGLYCAKCNKWLTWLSSSALTSYKLTTNGNYIYSSY